MNKIQKRLATFVAASSLFLQVATPLAASSTDLEIVGNGRDTENNIEFQVLNETSVVQSNDADIENNVSVDANTGGNEAEDNVGGDVSIDTGDVEVEADITNTANSNVADVDGCCDQDAEVRIEGNAADTDNNAELELGALTEVYQENNADVENSVEVDANTGDNEAEDNVGGSVDIETGSVKVKPVTIANSLNSNSAMVGGGGGFSVSAYIVGNGRKSDNEIDLDVLRQIVLVQSNDGDIENDVAVDANTGDNEAEDNIGGDVTIDTGDVEVSAEFDTMANFNWADVDCDCLADVTAKIAYNLKDSDNTIEGDLGSALGVFQANCEDDVDWDFGGGGGHHQRNGDCGTENALEVGANTGDNEAEDNGGDVDGDPSIETGDVSVDADFETSGNSNVYGEDEADGIGLSLPGGLFLQVKIDLNDILAWLNQ